MNSALLTTVTIDPALVAGADLIDFTVLIETTQSALQGIGDESFGFKTSPDEWLGCEIERYDAGSGHLRAWVKLPSLSHTDVTRIEIHRGAPEAENSAWDDATRLALLNPPTGDTVDLPLGQLDAVTVEAWVETGEAGTEAMQTLVASWNPRETFDRFAAYDAGQTDGLDTTGFFGAVFDGRYVYFVPQHDLTTRHGKALRYDTHGAFEDPASWAGYDAGHTEGLNTKGYYGAIFDGRYVYFSPRRDALNFHSRVLRYDTSGDFRAAGSWSAHDLGMPRSYQSVAFDGRFIYFCPGHVAVPKDSVEEAPDCSSPAVTGMSSDYYLAGNSIVVRYDTQAAFKDPASWTTYDAAETGGHNTSDYDGAVYDGRYVYFVPLSTGIALRYDTHGDFAAPASWVAYDARPHGIDQCVGGVFDGNYVYFVPYAQTVFAVRYDIRGEFSDPASWSGYDFTRTANLAVRGFDGGAYDGRYVYFIPYYDGEGNFHSVLLRYDTTKAFDEPHSWDWVDAEHTGDVRTLGFNAGAYDGRYLYCAPWQDGSSFPTAIVGHGKVLRYDTVGEEAAFCLRFCDYGHNGGLNAALPGARFLVNTADGPRSVAANRPPQAGRHYLAGVFDGAALHLYIDGELVNSQPCNGSILSNGPISFGSLLNGEASFRGRVRAARVTATARSAEWVATHHRNLTEPTTFCAS